MIAHAARRARPGVRGRPARRRPNVIAGSSLRNGAPVASCRVAPTHIQEEARMRQTDDALSNPSSSPSFEAVLAARYSRRQVLTGGLVAAGAALLGTGTLRPGPARSQSALLGFRGVPV